MDEEQTDHPKRAPAFQFYCRDWLTSEKVKAMSDKGVRAYINLLAHAWLSSPPGTLPNDDRRLMLFSGVSRQGWKTVREEVLACFEGGGIRLVCPPLRAQSKSIYDSHLNRVKAGAKGAAKRWEKPDNQSPENGNAISKTMANDGTASASASALHTATAFVDGKTGEPEPRGHERRLTVNCEICGWIEDHDRHTKCHYCWRVFTPKEKYGSSHRCP